MGFLWVGKGTVWLHEFAGCITEIHGAKFPGLQRSFCSTLIGYYLDDLLVFSSDFSSHLKDLQLTLQRLRKYGVKIKAKKCQLFRRQVCFSGRIVAADGYKLDPNNIKAVKGLVRWKPKTLGNVRRLLWMIGYFRKYISNFSKISEHLYVLLKKTEMVKVAHQNL